MTKHGAVAGWAFGTEIGSRSSETAQRRQGVPPLAGRREVDERLQPNEPISDQNAIRRQPLQGRTIAQIVTYAAEGDHHGDFSALAGYSKDLLGHMDPATQRSVVVLSDIKSVPRVFQDGELLIDECFNRASSFVRQITQRLADYPQLQVIHLQHEFNAFGGPLTILQSLWLLWLLRVVHRKSIVVTFHGVISQAIIDRQFIQLNTLPGWPWLIRVAFWVYYVSARFLINRVIVHAEKFQRILQRDYGYRQPIDVIGIGVTSAKRTMTQRAARTSLNLPRNKRVLLYFGFLAGYKGLDLLLDAYEGLDQDRYQLLIAGGQPKRVANDPTYQEWYARLVARAKSNPTVRLAGFVANDQIETYFTAADLAIFPYLLPLSSSAALATAIGYETPSIVSSAFEGLVDPQLMFAPTAPALANKIQTTFQPQQLTKNQAIITQMKQMFTWERSAAQTAALVQRMTTEPSRSRKRASHSETR